MAVIQVGIEWGREGKKKEDAHPSLRMRRNMGFFLLPLPLGNFFASFCGYPRQKESSLAAA